MANKHRSGFLDWLVLYFIIFHSSAVLLKGQQVINFGNVQIGNTSAINNYWWFTYGIIGDYYIDSESIVGPDASDFTVSPNYNGDSLEFEVTYYYNIYFTPSHAGVENASLYLSSDLGPSYLLAGTGAISINGRVLDAKTQQPLGGVTISLSGQNTTTSAGGAFVFASTSLTSGNTLSASKSGYQKASLTVAPTAGAGVITVPDVTLQPTAPTNQPVVTSLNSSFMPVFISGLPIADQFTAAVDWNGSTPGDVEFYANNQLVNTLTGPGPTYTATLDSSYFNPSLAAGGNTLSVVAKNSQGTASTPSTLQIFDVPYLSSLALVFPSGGFQPGPNSFSIDIDANWPNPPISTPLLVLPVIGAFGMDFKVNPHFEYDFHDGKWELGIGNVSEQQNSGAGGNQNFTLLLGPNYFSGTVTLGGSGTVSPVSGFTDTEVYVGLQMSGKYKLGQPFGLLDFLLGPEISGVVSQVPVVGGLVKAVSLQIYAEPEIGGNIKLTFPEFQFQSAVFGGSCALTAEYEPQLGNVGKLKAYVGGKPLLNFQIPSKPPGGYIQNVGFVAYAGIELDVWAFSFSGEYVFLNYTYPGNNPNLMMQQTLAGQWVSVSSGSSNLPQFVARPNLLTGGEGFVAYDVPAQTKLSSAGQTSSLENFRAMGQGATYRSPAGASGNGPQPNDAGFSVGSLAQADLTLVTNAFPNNDPVIDAYGQELMLLYITDNGSANNLNFTDINWTRFDGTNWSTPLTIQTNTQAEFEPQVKYDGTGNAIAVWDRVNDPNFNQTNLTAMAADMEVVWSRWNRTNGTWSTPIALTANNYLDHAPLLCGPMSDGSLLLTWTANTFNLLMGTNGAGSQIFWSQWSPANQTWSAPQILVSNLTYRLSQSLSGASNLAVYAWSQDTVGTLTNLPDDQEFFCVWSNGVWSAAHAFTTNAFGNRNARVAVSPSRNVNWVWQQGTNLMMSTNFSVNQILMRSNSQTAGFSDFAMTFGPANNLFLLWQDMTTNGCHAHYMVYDPVSATWSQDELLRSDPPLERSFAAVWDNAGNLTVAYDVVNTFITNITATLSDGTLVTVTNVPQPGQVDIAVTKRALIRDLALLPGDFVLSGTNYLPGGVVTLSANVSNDGDLGLSNVVVSFYDGNPSAGGILISNVTVAGWLPGASTNGLASAIWVVPTPATNHVLYAVVNQTNVSAEFNPTNNTQSVSVGGTDLAVSMVSYNALTNGSVRVIAQVQNLGAPTATNSTLAIRSYGSTGIPLANVAIPALIPGELVQAALDLPAGTQPAGEAVYQLYADDTHVVPDVNTNNNIVAFPVYSSRTLTIVPFLITAPPTNEVVMVGTNAAFSVGVLGPGPFTYQWQFNGTNLPLSAIITTVAGNGIAGFSGDGGAATNASLLPKGVAVDGAGDLFIVESGNQRIRKVNTSGIITTVAGNGSAGFSGDGGAATNATLNLPSGVAVDGAGNLFIVDPGNHRIRKVSTSGIITTVAGNGGAGFSGDGGAATNATFVLPSGVAVDGVGNLFIVDESNQRIRKVNTSGIITTVAGNGNAGFSGDGGAATNAKLSVPIAVAVDGAGNLFIVDQSNQRIRKVNTSGIITTVAGNGSAGFSGDGGAATNATLSQPCGVAVDGVGNLFIVDQSNQRIRKVNTSGIITTVAGNGSAGFSGDGGAAINASFYYPYGVAVDGADNLFIADYGSRRIREVKAAGPTLTLAMASLQDKGNYDVVVSNPYGSVTSSVVNLTITLPPPILSSPQITAGNTNFAFLLSGPFGSNYVLQVSTNLLDWSSVSTSTIPASGTVTLTNVISGYDRRFYRVHLQ